MTAVCCNEEPESKKLYGFYSEKAVADNCSTVFYSTPDGGEVEVTVVSTDVSPDWYQWDDKVCVGEVVQYLRQGQVFPEDQKLADEWDDLARNHDYQDQDYDYADRREYEDDWR